MYYKNYLYYAESTERKAQVSIVGLPYDSTVSFRPGSRFGPPALRDAATGVESYSPYFDRELFDIAVHDFGDFEIPFGDPVAACADIEKECRKKWLRKGKKLISIGGEHLLSYPLVKCHTEIYGKDLQIIQLDAHADLRKGYLGRELSHASVIKLIQKELSFKNIRQFFIRSGTPEEWKELRKNKNNFLPLENDFSIADVPLDDIGDKPVYLTIDIDVFDPSVCPGTGTPEAGGIQFNQFMLLLKRMQKLNIVGADILELAPGCDPSGCSSVLAAKVMRELICLIA